MTPATFTPDPAPCAGCAAELSGCEAKRMLSGRACCPACVHREAL